MVSTRLLSGCALAAILTAGAPLRAQAFQGTPTTAFGSVTYDRATPGTETLTINSSTAVIDWSPSDTAAGATPIDFLPNGALATFTGDPAGNFTVLNRVLPTGAATGRAIGINGTVRSGLDDPSLGFQPGGSVWFYSPGGIFVGSTGIFDVGNLLLTANDIAIDINGIPPGPSVSLSLAAAANSRATVQVAPGATINATVPGSYVALIAPRVIQSGAVNVNGTAAYVAAEAATVQINAGLFDIDFLTGSFVDGSVAGDGQVLRHDGATNIGGTGPQQIVMAAMPKNEAITMLVSGTVGYDPASVASVVGDTIVLSGGTDIIGNDVAPVSETTLGTSIQIGTGVYGPALKARATDTIDASGSMAFGSVADFQAGRQALMSAVGGQTITVGGALNLAAQYIASDGTLTGGTARLQATGGSTVTISGSLSIDAGAYTTPYDLLPFPPSIPDTSAGVGAQGGAASLEVNASTLSVGGTAHVSADAVGGDGGFAFDGGNGIAGNASASFAAGSTANISSDLRVTTRGRGGNGATAGSGTGGDAGVTVDASTLDTTNRIDILAFGEGGGAQDAGVGGDGVGGAATFSVLGAGAQVDAFDMLIDAGGFGGSHLCGFSCSGQASSGGNGTGGTAIFNQSAGLIQLASIQAAADGRGGDGFEEQTGGNGGRGGNGSGGTVRLDQTGGTLQPISSGLAMTFTASGRGGFGGSAIRGSALASGNGGAGGNATAGHFTATLRSNLMADFLSFAASADGGGGGGSEDANGGTAGTAGPSGSLGSSMVVIGGGGNVTLQSLSLETRAFGGGGGDTQQGTAAVGGAAQGGTAILTNGAGLNVGSLSINADAAGGTGGTNFSTLTQFDGGDATGGTAQYDQTGGNAEVSFLTVAAEGIVGSGENLGATAKGGTARVALTGGTLGVTSGMEINATGRGFDIELSAGGDATGGDATFLAQNGANFTFGGQAISIRAEGVAGSGGGASGNGFGGNASFGVDNANVTLDAGLLVSADGLSPSETGTSGGNGTGGTAAIFAINSGTLTLNAVAGVSANGTGGSQDPALTGNGGNGFGGNANLLAQNGTIDGTSPLEISANGTGGAAGIGGVAGAGTAGSAGVTAEQGDITLASLDMSALGSGSGPTQGVNLSATDGNIKTAGPLSADSDVAIRARGSGSGSIISGGLLSFTTRAIIDISHTAASAPTLSGNSVLLSANGALTGASGSRVDSTGDMTLIAGGPLSMADVRGNAVSASGSSVTIGSGGPLTLVQAVASAGDVAITTGGVLTISGDVLGANISLTSTGIDIGGAANVGDLDTNLIAIANSSGVTEIGDGPSAGGYRLSNAAFARLQAHDIRISGPGNVVIGQLDIIGSAGSGRRNLTGSTLDITAAGDMLVNGAVSLTGAGSGDALSLTANTLLRVATPGGSVAVTDAAGAPGGQLNLSAARIEVTSDGAHATLPSLATMDARSERLDVNDGTLLPEGQLRAGGIRANVSQALYIQNSGGTATFADHAGFTTGTGGFTIGITGDGTPEIIINGRIGATGGDAIIPLLQIQDGQGAPTLQIARRSTANGCLILGPSCDAPDTFDIPPVQDVINDVIDDEGDNGAGVEQAFAAPLIEIPDFDPLDFVPLIDEPVTGTGNEGLWVGTGS